MEISSPCLSSNENEWFRDNDLEDELSGNFQVVAASKSPSIDVEDASPFQLLDDAAHSDDVDVDSECPLQFLSEFETHDNQEEILRSQSQKRGKKRAKKNEEIKMEGNEVEGVAEDIPDEDDEMKKIRTRFKQGCDCEDSNCFQSLDPRSVYRHRLNIAELTKAEHDMYLMGLIKACISCNQTTKNKERQRLRSHYFYQGRKVCLTAFLFLENCTRYQLKAMRCHLMSHGVTPRVHGNQGKRPHNVFSLETYNQASEFLKKFFEQTSAGSGYGRTPLTISLDHLTRKHIHALYTKQHTSNSNDRLMGYSTFLYFMKHQFPHVKFVKQDSLSKIGKELNSREKLPKSNLLDQSYCTIVHVPHHNNNTGTAHQQYQIIVSSSDHLSSQLINAALDNVEVLENVAAIENVEETIDNVEEVIDNVEEVMENVEETIENVEEVIDNVEEVEGVENHAQIENQMFVRLNIPNGLILDSEILDEHIVDGEIFDSQIIETEQVGGEMVETYTVQNVFS